MSAVARAVPVAVAIASLALAAVAGLDAVEMARGAAPGWSLPPQPSAYDAAAERLRVSDPARARSFSRAALAWRPVDGRAWLDLARVDAGRAGRLGPAAQSELERSYEAAPYELALAQDRIALAYGDWPDLTDDLRRSAASEVRTTWSLPEHRPVLMAAVQRVGDPQGRLALAMELLRLKVSEDAAAGAPGPAG
jgi:hypothetical protein